MTYTVEEEAALHEAARILANAGSTLESAIEEYKSIIALLSEDDGDRNLNKVAVIAEATQALARFRIGLLQLDTRAGDVTQILEALDNYWRTRTAPAPEDAPPETTTDL